MSGWAVGKIITNNENDKTKYGVTLSATVEADNEEEALQKLQEKDLDQLDTNISKRSTSIKKRTKDIADHSKGYAEYLRHCKSLRVADQETAEKKLKPLMEEGDKLAIVEANNTTDSGVGYLLQLQDGDLELIDQKEGYEGARASDVTGYFREEHNIDIGTGYQ